MPFYGHQKVRYARLNQIDHYAALRFHLNYMPLMIKIERMKVEFGDVLTLVFDSTNPPPLDKNKNDKWARVRWALRKSVRSAIQIHVRHERWTRLHVKGEVGAVSVHIGHYKDSKDRTQRVLPHEGSQHRCLWSRDNTIPMLTFSFCTMLGSIPGNLVVRKSIHQSADLTELDTEEERFLHKVSKRVNQGLKTFCMPALPSVCALRGLEK